MDTPHSVTTFSGEQKTNPLSAWLSRSTPFLVLLPSLIVIAIFVYGFIGVTAYTSVTNSTSVRVQRGTVELVEPLHQNYESLFNGLLNKRFRQDMVNNIFFTGMFIASCLVVGLGLAILLDQKIVGEGLFRTIFLFPMALSFVVTGVVWKWLFNPNSGLNTLPTYIGLPALPADQFRWFLDENQAFKFDWQNVPYFFVMLALLAVIFFGTRRYFKTRSQNAMFAVALALFLSAVLTLSDLKQAVMFTRSEVHGFNNALIAITIAAAWQMSGYTMAMYLAGLRGISDDLREAARVDGATELGIYRHVIFPLLRPITLSAVIILGHISLKIFDLVYTMAGETNLFVDMPGINMFLTTFRGFNFGLGSAIAMVMLVMVAVVIIPYLITSLRPEKGH